jgi:hypothetical protein
MMTTSGCALSLGLMVSSAGQAALAPEYYLGARQSAAHHVQVVVTRVSTHRGRCAVWGDVAVVFRGPLRVGSPVVFSASCHRAGARPLPGSEPSFDARQLAAARVLEGFFDGRAPALTPALGQFARVSGVRDRPWCSTEARSCQLP